MPRSTCVGTVNVLEAARLVGARVVFASTGGAIYGECERPAREDDPCLPLSPYGAAKLAGEGYLGAFARLYGTPHVALRFGNVYGPRQDPHGEAGVVAIFLGRLLEGAAVHGSSATGRRAATTSTSGTSRARRSRRSTATSGGVFNVGTGIATSVLELYDVCRSVAGSDADARPRGCAAGRARRGACSTASSPRPRSGSAPRRRSRTASPRPGSRSAPTASGAITRRGKEPSARGRTSLVVDVSLQHDDRLIRPWRTAALVAVAVAAVELLVLVVVGGALIAKPSTGTSRPAGQGEGRAGERSTPRQAAAKHTVHRAAAPAAHLSRTKVTVLVLNGNGRQGAAAATASRVSRRGYRIGGVANAPSSDFTRSLVMYRRGFEGEGRRLARDLGIGIVGPLDGLRTVAAPRRQRRRRRRRLAERGAVARRLGLGHGRRPLPPAGRILGIVDRGRAPASSAPSGVNRLLFGSSVYAALRAKYALHWLPSAIWRKTPSSYQVVRVLGLEPGRLLVEPLRGARCHPRATRRSPGRRAARARAGSGSGPAAPTRRGRARSPASTCR